MTASQSKVIGKPRYMVDRIYFWVEVTCPLCADPIVAYQYTVAEIESEVLPALQDHARSHD